MSTLLEVEDLEVQFGRPGAPGTVRAVDGVSFKVEKGRTLGLVGESGCGKSTTGYAILQLVRATGGRVLFDGTDLRQLGRRELRRMRRKLQIIFQDAHASLNPRLPIGDLVGEALDIHGLVRGRAARATRVRELLDMVGLSGQLIERYPHELSGGQAQRQRIILKGDLPNPADPPSGCRFRTRCPIAIDECAAIDPPQYPLGAGHWAKCIRLKEE
jgi:oligopeptide transport system ATP-binding protein